MKCPENCVYDIDRNIYLSIFIHPRTGIKYVGTPESIENLKNQILHFNIQNTDYDTIIDLQNQLQDKKSSKKILKQELKKHIGDPLEYEYEGSIKEISSDIIVIKNLLDNLINDISSQATIIQPIQTLKQELQLKSIQQDLDIPDVIQQDLDIPDVIQQDLDIPDVIQQDLDIPAMIQVLKNISTPVIKEKDYAIEIRGEIDRCLGLL